MRSSVLHRVGRIVGVAAILAAAIVVGALAAGYRPVVIQTGSMGDTAPPGSLVVAAPRSGDAIEVGDIVVMRRPGATPVTHRVIEIEPGGTGRFAVTQGDANEAPDAAPYPLGAQDELVARWIVPGLGGRLETLFQPGVSLVVLAVAVVWVTVSALRRVWGKPEDEENEEREESELTEVAVAPAAPAPETRSQRRRRLVGLAALPMVALLTVGVAWALFQSSESVASNDFGTRECFDPQLASVQDGETIHAVDGIVEVPITAVDPTEAFVLASVRSAANEPADVTAAVSLRGDGAAVVIDRETDAGAPPQVTVAWSVVHYDCGVTVQHGSTPGNGTAQVDVTVAAVDAGAAFAIVTSAADRSATTFGGADLHAAALTSSTNLRISSDPSTTLAATRTFHWQVVSFDDPGDAAVQVVSEPLGVGVGSATVTLPTPVDPSTTFLLASVTTASSGVDVGERMVRAHLVDANTVAIDRSVSGDPIAVQIQAVTLKDGSTVRHGTVDLDPGQPTRAVAVEPVDPTRSTAISTVAVPGLAAGGQTDQAVDDVVGEGTATFALANATTVNVQRAATASAASFGWQVIEWAGPSWWDPDYDFRQRIDVDTGSASAPGAYSVPLTFDHAALVSTGLATSATGTDLRVVRWDGASWTELDRVLDDGGAWNGVATTIWFRTVDPIAAEDTGTYWLYFGNDAPGPALEDPEAVYLLTEDFESGDLGDFEDRTGGTGWYEADPWTRRIPLTIPAGRVGSDLTDFPVLVSLTDADLATNAQADGSDLRFVAADGTTPLAHEIEDWDAGSGTLVAWVRVPTLTAATPTSLYLVYGAPNAPSQDDVRGTWPSDVEAAWHMSADPAGPAPQLDDSTPNNHDGVNRGGMTNADLVPGLIGDAIDFDGVDDMLEADPFDLAGVSGLTMSAWVRLDTAINEARVINKATTPATRIFELSLLDTGAVRARLRLDGSSTTVARGPGSVTTGSWHHVAAVWDGATLELFADGVSLGSAAAVGALDADASMPVTIGNIDSVDRPLDGLIDEVRVARVARSAAWLAAAESNQRNPATFVVAGGVETGTWFAQGTWGARKPIGIDPSITDADLTDVAVPISIVDPQLQSSANADGSDIVFTAADGTTRLDHVVETWDSGTGTLTAWVRVPTLSSSAATQLFVYYANPTAADQQDGPAVFGPDTDLTLTGSS